MLETVEQFLNEYNLTSSDKTFLVGFSGGCDSLCLLDILQNLSKKFGQKLVALHLNHNWRGDESRQEEQNCKNFCKDLGIEFVSETLQNNVEKKNENFAREARYSFFLKYAKKYPNSVVFTAHNRTDNAETIIYRIIKGTGVRGIQGIPAKIVKDGVEIYRPILQIPRKRIEDYCSSKGLIANTDSSNFDISFKRNFIRHKIMPLFDEINFHAERSIASLAKMAISQGNIVDEYMRIIRHEIADGDRILSQKVKKLSDDVMRKFIHDACMKRDLEYDSKRIDIILDFIKANLDSKSGSRLSIANDLWLFVNSKHIYLINETKAETIDSQVRITSEGSWDFPENRVFSLKKFVEGGPIAFPSENAPYAYVDLSKIELDLTLRTRREGDFIIPFGMKGSMKLKKYLNSKGVAQHEKDNLVLLCKGNEVLWVAGVGISNKLRVDKIPTYVLKLENRVER